MSAFDRVLMVKLIADTSDINQKLPGTTSLMGTLGTVAKGAALGLAAEGVALLVTKMGEGFDEATRMRDAVLSLTGVLEDVGVQGDDASAAIAAVAEAATGLGFDDVQATAAFQELLLQTRDVDDAMVALQGAFDLARATGDDLATATGTVQGLIKGSARSLAVFGVTSGATANSIDNVGLALSGLDTAAEDYASTVPGKLASANEVIGDVFAGIAEGVLALADEALPLIESVVIPAIQTLLALLVPIAEKVAVVAGQLIAIGAAIAEKVQPVLGPFVEMMSTGLLVSLELVSGALDVITKLLSGDFAGAWEAVQATVENVIGRIVGLITAMGTAMRAMMDPFVEAFRSAVNAVIDFLNSLRLPGFSVPNPLHGTILDPFHTPHIKMWDAVDLFSIPRMARGGIVDSPTLALIGEAGREAVVPLDEGPLGTTINIVVQGQVVDPVGTGRAIVRALRAYEATEGALWRGGSGTLRHAR